MLLYLPVKIDYLYEPCKNDMIVSSIRWLLSSFKEISIFMTLKLGHKIFRERQGFKYKSLSYQRKINIQSEKQLIFLCLLTTLSIVVVWYKDTYIHIWN